MFTEASELIRHMLTVNPAHRANIHDICTHWWLNLGYTKTPSEEFPKGQPVNFIQLEDSLNASLDNDSENFPKKGVIRKPLKGILKKPKDFSPKYSKSSLERQNAIIPCDRNCDDRTCVSIHNKHNTSHKYIDIVTDNSLADLSSASHSISPSSSVFDSTKKPKRGILKNSKKRYSSDDSDINADDINFSEYFCSSDSVPTSPVTDVANKDDANVSTDHEDSCYDVADIEEVLCGLELDCGLIPGNINTTTDRNVHESTAASFDLLPLSDSSSSATTPHRKISLVSTGSDLSPGSFGSLTGETSTPVRLKGILKRNGKWSQGEPSWRYSMESQSSNSSGDILDFSYDEGEGEAVLNYPPLPEWTPPDMSSCSVNRNHSLTCDNLCNDALSTSIDPWLPRDSADISVLDDMFFETSVHRNTDSTDLFNYQEAKDVYKKALEFC